MPSGCRSGSPTSGTGVLAVQVQHDALRSGQRGCHALALDDERAESSRCCGTRRGRRLDTRRVPRIEQVWFSGAHSNVGGGYPRQGMSLVALDWMMKCAAAEDIRFVAHMREEYTSGEQSFADKLYDPRSGWRHVLSLEAARRGRRCAASAAIPVPKDPRERHRTDRAGAGRVHPRQPPASGLRSSPPRIIRWSGSTEVAQGHRRGARARRSARPLVRTEGSLGGRRAACLCSRSSSVTLWLAALRTLAGHDRLAVGRIRNGSESNRSANLPRHSVRPWTSIWCGATRAAVLDSRSRGSGHRLSARLVERRPARDGSSPGSGTTAPRPLLRTASRPLRLFSRKSSRKPPRSDRRLALPLGRP